MPLKIWMLHFALVPIREGRLDETKEGRLS
jgi:hypothetical protein